MNSEKELNLKISIRTFKSIYSSQNLDPSLHTESAKSNITAAKEIEDPMANNCLEVTDFTGNIFYNNQAHKTLIIPDANNPLI